MNYRINPKNGQKLSLLAFGFMRLKDNEQEIKRQVEYAVDHGVNYFDTAYVYPNSELRLGRALAGDLRKRVNIATKLPPYMVKKYEDMDKIFNTQLSRLQTDYIDYYMIHMLTNVSVWERLEKIRILDWIEQKKKSGQIRNIGFSYHGGKEEFPKLVDACDWDFCMIQYNYLDENRQASRSGLEYASAKGLPVMVMEPLRGGKLAAGLPKEASLAFDRAHVKRSAAEWAFRWLYDQPEVTTVLSGMNSMEMLKENIRVASEAEAGVLTQADFDLFKEISGILKGAEGIPCTGCNYCMPCPAGVDIPTCFSCYNDRKIEARFSALKNYMMQTALASRPANAGRCVKCGKCEAHCPQKIEIGKELANVKKRMEGFYYRPIAAIAKRFLSV